VPYAEIAENAYVFFARFKHVTAVFINKQSGDIVYISTLIAVVRKSAWLTDKLAISGVDGFAKNHYLVTVIIEIIFPGYFVAGKIQYISQHIAYGSLPAMRNA
jgi:hypothetical protein